MLENHEYEEVLNEISFSRFMEQVDGKILATSPQTWSGKLLLELMITERNKQNNQSRTDPAFALWQLNIDSGMLNHTLLMTLIEARKSDGK